MILVGINHELRLDAETAERLVHLLASGYRHVEIALAAQKERRSFDTVGVEEWVREFLIGLPSFRVPWRADLVVVLNNILVRSIEANRESCARAAGRRLEAIVAGDQVIGQDAAIAPTADAQPIWISHPHLDDVIDARLQVLDFVMTPVGEDRARELLPSAGAAAIIHGQDRVSIGREELPLQTE